ncbi:helicase domain protein [Nitzschia inconspicua]|uniref:Helicase domain protein n=1 Tax=Nitzschia inconspicua TaxID=303405 RepID=A0A9K3KDN7_9STRA|nr:helicase domain protein [Nitzschia inconspicua]
MDSIGFVWTLDTKDRSQQARDEDAWKKTVDRLKGYKQQRGHVNVPLKYNDGQRPHLGVWVRIQRSYYRECQNPNYNEGVMTEKRVEILESHGFEWNPGRKDEFEKTWMSQFEDMKKFVKKYNATKVTYIPGGCKSSIAVAINWANFQRASYSQYIKNETSPITPQH